MSPFPKAGAYEGILRKGFMGRIYGNGFLHLNTPLCLFLWIRVDSNVMICLLKCGFG